MLVKGDTVRQVSVKLQIPRSTLDRWRHRPSMVLGSGRCTVLEAWEEDLLVLAFNFMSDAGLPIGRHHLVNMVRQYCVDANRETPFTGDAPGHRWIEGFEARNNHRLRRRHV